MDFCSGVDTDASTVDRDVQIRVWAGNFYDSLASGFATPTILGPCPVRDRDGVMNLICRDLYDAAGVPERPARLETDWS